VRTVKNVYQEEVCLNGIKGSKAARKVRMQKLRMKTMLAVFFDAKDIHHKFMPEKQTVNGKFHKEVIRRLVTQVLHVRPELQESGYDIFCTTVHWPILRASSPSFW
jgi:hypothetical protein